MADQEFPMIEILFWLFVVILGFTFAGYSVFMRVWSRLCRPVRTGDGPSQTQCISFVIVAANEESRIVERIQNLLEAAWPSEKLEVVLVSDGSTDKTAEKVRTAFAADHRIKVIELPARLGKANGLNHAVAAATGEIIVFADARQRFEKETVPLLLRSFADPEAGAVSGRLVVDSGASAVGQGVGSYWSMETKLRSAESQVDSCIGCTGAVYALRRNLYEPIPVDTLLDDVVIPMQIAVKGSRVLYEPDALAHDPQELAPEREEIRKRRTLAGNFQMLFRYPAWLLPWKNRLWLQLIAHKYLRLAGPVLLLGILATSMALMTKPFYQACFYAQAALYGLALVGLSVPGLKMRLFSLPAGFLFLNWMIIRGFLHYLSAPRSGAWEMTKKTSPAP